MRPLFLELRMGRGPPHCPESPGSPLTLRDGTGRDRMGQDRTGAQPQSTDAARLRLLQGWPFLHRGRNLLSLLFFLF